MSKVSVFKFNLGCDSDDAKKIVKNYLISRKFVYNSEKKCYFVGDGEENNKKKNVLTFGTAVAVGAATVGNFVPVNNGYDLGFEYFIKDGQLIIKAFIFNKIMGSKNFIHSTFNNSLPGINYYSDLKNNLFNKLKDNNINLQDKEIEKIKDGCEKKFFTFYVFIYMVVIILSIFLILIFNR